MNLDLLFAILFYGAIFIFFLKNKDKFEIQGKVFALYRTQIGLKLMEKISKFYPKFLKILGVVSITTGFGGMLFIFYWLIKGTINLLLVPNAIPAVAPVLPGVQIKGMPLLSFWHWVIAIFIVAVVHEFSHGVFAKLYNVKIKSSGFAFLGPILAAFVEPDEKTLEKKTKKAQLSIFSAGPFANFILGIIFLLLVNLITMPIENKMLEGNGIIVNGIVKGYPAENLNTKLPFTITGINNKKTLDAISFLNTTNKIKPDQVIVLNTNKGDFSVKTVEDPENKSKGFMGITNFKIQTKIKESVKVKVGTALPTIFSWFNMLFFWLVVVNIGVGLFNLLPLGPVDGGRMFYTALLFFFKNEKKSKKIWTLISVFCLLLILINLSPYLMQLFLFIAKPFLYIFNLIK